VPIKGREKKGFEVNECGLNFNRPSPKNPTSKLAQVIIATDLRKVSRKKRDDVT